MTSCDLKPGDAEFIHEMIGAMKLTPAQERALLWLPKDGKETDAVAGINPVAMANLVERHWVTYRKQIGSPHLLFALTPAGIYAHAWNAALEAVAVLEDASARQDKDQSLKFFRDGDRFRGLLYDGYAQIHEASARRCRTLKGSAP